VASNGRRLQATGPKLTGRSAPRSLRLLSFNIHAGTSTERFHHYVTQSWRQVLPHAQRVDNLDVISELVSQYDMAALQEVDTGSLRSGFLNQSRYIATHAGMPFWTHQSNRKLGAMSLTGNGFMGRFEPTALEEHRLPGVIPGRGSLILRFGEDSALVVAVVHLALGRRARDLQLGYLIRHLDDARNLIVLGDLNTDVTSPQMRQFCERLGLTAATEGLLSYPSWQPQRAIDHILVSDALKTRDVEVLTMPVSDHCPVALTVDLPPGLKLEPSRTLLSAVS
jgi:endonuclease/exonuclease/phosphatase family metal-dependent hydrolase